MQCPENAPEVYDYIILGCGISALTAAKQLCENHSVLVLESYKDPGGNHQSHTIDGMEFDIGSICFNTADEQFRHFPELLRECVAKDVEVKKICTNGAVGKYPFDWQVEASSFNLLERISCIWSLLRGRFRADRYDSARGFAQSRIGDVLYRRVGLDLYIRRLFGVDAARIDYDFALKRMQWLSRETSLRHRFRRSIKNRLTISLTNGKTVVRPSGGFGLYYQKALDGLRGHGVHFIFDNRALKIETSSPLMEIKTATGTFLAKRLISTIPLDEASALCDLPETGLPTVTLLSLFVALRGSWIPGCSVLYNFHTGGNWKRITVHSDFYPYTNSYDKHFTVEITVPPTVAAPTPECAFSELLAHLRQMNLIEGELFLIGSSELKNAYPIPEKGFKPRRDAAIARLASKGVICLGRQGKFEYIPHSNIAAKEAITVLNQMVKPITAC
ncbi:NAD(P)-binding protein [Pararhizobium sp. BT-229]|uniref:NAD(P)-binding protein n=1 Tax=Pararhizobium sp. BT-229 TaxID=2986923 RepID=UPI0021F6A4F3|nr:NAD(P)-binding protein [Pararhizobium sp. BT-229]MCV9967732.1 NAD(P)-binding protein [Pararhizobium sp. BT-229]